MNPHEVVLPPQYPEIGTCRTNGIRLFVLTVSIAQFSAGFASFCIQLLRVPGLAKLYSSFGSGLSLLTVLLLQLSDICIKFSWFVGLGIGGIIGFVIWHAVSARGPALFRWGAGLYAVGGFAYVLSAIAKTSLDAPLQDLAAALLDR